MAAIFTSPCSCTVFFRSASAPYGAGFNECRQLGLADSENRSAPQQLHMAGVGAGCVDVRGGEYHNLALDANGIAYATAFQKFDDYYGQNVLGDARSDSVRFVALKLPRNTKVVQIASGFCHALLLDAGSAVWAVGVRQERGRTARNGRHSRATPLCSASRAVFGAEGRAHRADRIGRRV